MDKYLNKEVTVLEKVFDSTCKNWGKYAQYKGVLTAINDEFEFGGGNTI